MYGAAFLLVRRPSSLTRRWSFAGLQYRALAPDVIAGNAAISALEGQAAWLGVGLLAAVWQRVLVPDVIANYAVISASGRMPNRRWCSWRTLCSGPGARHHRVCSAMQLGEMVTAAVINA